MNLDFNMILLYHKKRHTPCLCLCQCPALVMIIYQSGTSSLLFTACKHPQSRCGRMTLSSFPLFLLDLSPQSFTVSDMTNSNVWKKKNEAGEFIDTYVTGLWNHEVVHEQSNTAVSVWKQVIVHFLWILPVCLDILAHILGTHHTCTVCVVFFFLHSAGTFFTHEEHSCFIKHNWLYWFTTCHVVNIWF